MNRILITGIAGFIGSNLADRLLKEGYSVVGIDNLSYGVREQVPSGVEFHKLDIRSKEIYPVFEGIDAVFHFAAKNCLPDCQKDPLETADINVTGTVNVFEAVRKAGVPKIIYAESSAIYEDRALGFYAISKMACNAFASGYREAYNVTSIGLRYFNVYGPRQDYRRTIPPVMSTFIIKALKNEPAILYDGDENNKRDFVAVDDVNDFHLLCLRDARADNKVFDIGSGSNYSVLEVYNAVKDLLKNSAEPIRRKRLPDDPVVQTLADITQSKDLGWAPRVLLREGLEQMIAYIREEMKKGNIK